MWVVCVVFLCQDSGALFVPGIGGAPFGRLFDLKQPPTEAEADEDDQEQNQ